MDLLRSCSTPPCLSFLSIVFRAFLGTLGLCYMKRNRLYHLLELTRSRSETKLVYVYNFLVLLVCGGPLNPVDFIYYIF